MKNIKTILKPLLWAAVMIINACSSSGGMGSAGHFLPGDGLPKQHSVDIASVADAVPTHVILSATGNRPYRVFGKDYIPLRSAKGYQAQGVASWYGTKFHGRKTSSGEAYNMFAMSAAHRTLPLPSFARVSNLNNNRSVIVKINDRGPFVDTDRRIIDLSYAAAAKLGVVASGTARVRIEAITVPGARKPAKKIQEIRGIPPVKQAKPAANTPQRNETVDLSPSVILTTSAAVVDPQNASYLQMGAFSVRHNAEQLLTRLSKAGVAAYLQQDQALFKVKSGPYVDADQALRQKLQIDRLLDIEARVVFE